MFEEQQEGNTQYCTHQNKNEVGLCDKCLGIGIYKDIRNCFPLSTLSETTQDQIIELFDKRLERNVGMLRQWLNERNSKELLTNEDLLYWLNLNK